ncbi:MAG: HAD family hydrolase [candidate division Zixibacteria bacterium]|nr:HAD family hydrolase [candidate division Zixibacteria bacterium]
MTNENIRMVRHIIFDLDGTLIDSSLGVADAANYALTVMGENPRSLEEIARFIGYPLEEMFKTFTDAPPDKLNAAFQVRARHSVVASATALPGVASLLPGLQAAGYRLAIATTKFKIHTEGIVRKLGWDAYFAALASGDEVARVKPAPDIIELALRRLGADPDDTVMIGDTINDIIAARAAGIAKIIAVQSPFGADNIAAYKPDLMIARFSDLKKVFNLP